ncbi:MAG: putative serine/threonine protein kinase [Actinobacteria bacterium]|nr:putative serine/threonine protein kinase [Actinomycetota bacterium]
MLYELVTGTTPFATGVDPVAVLLAARERVPGPVPGFPARLWEVFAAMIARAPGDRPGAAGAARALGSVAAGLKGLPALPRLDRPPEPQVPEPQRATLLARGRPGSRTDPGRGVGAAPEGSARSRRQRLVLVVLLAAAVAVAGLVVAIALTRSVPPTTATFPLSIVGGTVAASRTWRLEGATLSGHVTLTNAGSSTQTVVYNEVIPTSVARSASALHDLQPPGPQVLENDPVLRFTFPDLGPGQSGTVSYEANVPASGPSAGRLGRLVADQVKAETAYLARTNLAVRQLSGLEVSPGSVVIAAGASQDLALSGTMNDGTPAPAAALGAAWTSSRPDIAAVTSGTVRALGPGTATVRAVVGTLSSSATITVTGAPAPSATAPSAARPTASASHRPPTASPTPQPSPPNPTPLPPMPPPPSRSSTPPPPPPPNRTAVVSYDRMAPGAPYWGQSPYGFQSFTARSNTLTYVGVTWGSGNYQPGSSVPGVTAHIRVCSGIGTPGSSDVACNGQLADVAAPVVNYGTSAADIGDVAVTPGATYYVVYYEPSAAPRTWDLFWWSCTCPTKGRNSAGLSDQNQMVVKGYNR